VNCSATPRDGGGTIGEAESDSEIPIGYAPVLNLIEDNSPTNRGSSIAFTGYWADDPDDSIFLKVCKVTNCNTKYCQSSLDSASPTSCTYITSNDDSISNIYYAYVCNANDEGCSSVQQNSFTVNGSIDFAINEQDLTFGSALSINLNNQVSNPYSVAYNILSETDTSIADCTINTNTLSCDSIWYGNSTACIRAINNDDSEDSCFKLNVYPSKDYVLVVDNIESWSGEEGIINITEILTTSKNNCNKSEEYCNITLEFYSGVKEKRTADYLEIYYTNLGRYKAFVINLTKGWNLIAIPLDQNDWKLGSILKQIQGNYSKIFTYESRWLELNNTSEIDENMGVWINMIEDNILNIAGNEITNPEIKGNLIGYPKLNTTPLNQVFNLSEIDYILSYENKTWLSYKTNRPEQLNTLTTIKPGQGYLVKSGTATIVGGGVR